jgi:hypothetical protein
MNAARKGHTSWSRTPRNGADAARLSDAAIRDALFRRVEEFLRESIAQMTDAELLAIISAPTDIETIARVVAASPVRVEDQNDWSQALLRGALHKESALRAAGGVLSSGEVADVLGITVAGVKQRQRRGKLLAVPTASGEWGYPARQFDEHGRVRAGLPAVIEAFGPETDPWVVLAFLTNPVPGSDTGVAFDSLDDPAATAALVHLAGTFGEHGAV